MIIHNPILTGSFTFNGTDVSSVTGSSTYSASFASSINSLNAATASLNSFSASVNTFTASAATTGSNTFVGNQVVTGSLNVSGSITTPGTLTAQTLVVQTITSSVDFVTGSTKFGSIISNTHQFTGSMSVSGSGTFVGNITAGDVIRVSGSGAYFTISDTQASSRNWAIRAGHDEVGDLAIRQSNSAGGDPVSAGTTRLYINASGSVGIGVIPTSTWNTITPVLQIGYTAFSAYLNTQAIYSSNAVYNSGWKYISSTNATYYSQNETAAGEHAWKTAPSGTAGSVISFTQVMTLDASGRLGIGTTSPSQRLHVANSSGGVVAFVQSTATNGEATLAVQGRNSSGTAREMIFKYDNTDIFRIGTASAIAMRFETSDVERVRITSGGNVGIGTSFGITSYLVSGQTSGVLQVATNIAKTSTATTDSYPIGFFGSNDASYPLGLYIGMLTGATTAARKVKLQGTEIGISPNDIVMQTDGGKVGIGMTSPTGKLEVKGEGGTTGKTLRLTDSAGNETFAMQDGGTGYFRYGNVGIGTTTPAQLLTLYSAGSTILRFQSGGANTDHWDAFSNVSARFYIWNVNTNNGAYLVYNSSSGWTSVSDARWKTNWTPLTNSLDLINRLNIGKYKMLDANKQPVENARWDYGVKAQELLEIIPDAVDVPDNPEDKHGVINNIVFYHAIKAIQELKAEFDEYKLTHP